MKTTIFLFIVLIFSVIQLSFAEIINVSNNAELTSANANAVAGDIVVIAGGTYTVTIKPANSGTAANRIVYRAANGANVIITNKNNLLNLSSGQDFITIENITFREPRGNNCRFLYANGADNIVLDGCKFMDDENALAGFTSSYITNGKDWEIKNCYWDMSNIAIELIPGINFKNQDGLVIDTSKRFYIHDNEFGDILHTSLAIRYNNRDFKISNNLFTNGWRHGIAVTSGGQGTSNEPQRILIENNTFLDIGARSNTNPRPPDRPRPTKSIGLQSSRVIIRGNVFDNNISPIQIFSQENRRITQNWIYHNTMNGSIQPAWVTRGLPGTSIHCQAYGTVTYNYIFNNILYDSAKNDIDLTNQGGGAPANNQIRNNIISDQAENVRVRWYKPNVRTSISALESSEPQFRGNIIDAPRFVNTANEDFRLTSTSGAINKARFLATISGKNGNQLTLGQNQGYAFWDGGGIAGHQGDVIYDNSGNSTIVISVDEHNKITIANASQFAVGAELTVVNYSGNRPDIGKYEYSEVLSINDNAFSTTISIIPNPIDNIFTISLKDDILEKVIIYNELGQQVKEVKTKEVDISNLSKGVYFVKITSQNGKSATKKVIKN